jgi:hypothetical protein
MSDWEPGRRSEAPSSRGTEDESREAGDAAATSQRADDATTTATASDVHRGEREEPEIGGWDDSEEEEAPAERRAPGPSGFPLWAAVLAAIIALLLTYSALRIAGEQHYQSCVSAVQGRYGFGGDALTRLVRQREIRGCSRSPF